MQKKFFLIIPFLFSCAKKKPTNTETPQFMDYMKQASSQAAAGNYETALNFANKASQTNPSPQASALKATLLYQLKRFEESEKLFKKIIDDKNTSMQIRCDVMNNYACNLLCLNKKEEAKKIWQELALCENYISPEVAYFNLGLLEFSQALEKKQALDADPQKKIQSNIKFANAAMMFERAVNIASNYVDAYYYLALSLEQIKKYDRAQEALAILLSKAPDHKPAKALLIRINRLQEEQYAS